MSDLTVVRAQLNPELASIEKSFNVLGYIPGLNLVSSSLRIVYGVMLVTSAVFLAIQKEVAASKHRIPFPEEEKKVLGEYAAHGFANIIRGTIEGATFGKLPIGGVILGIFYDMQKQRFKYSCEGSYPPLHIRLFEKINGNSSAFSATQQWLESAYVSLQNRFGLL